MYKWEENIRKVTPYVPGEQPQMKDVIKLNTNENPYPPSPEVEKRQRTMDVARFGLYPDPSAGRLVRRLEKYYGLDEGQIFVGVGSDDVLAMAFLTFFNSDRPILFPDITYSFYPVWANLYNIPYECPPLDEEFHIRVSDYKKENGGVVIANPNAPTSIAMSLSEIDEIVRENQDAVVIIDEAYVDFGGETALPLINKYENLLIVRTYSKSRSLAGMRIGFAMGNKRLIQAMKDVKESVNSYTMTTESIEIGVASLEDETYFRDTLKKVIKTREWTKNELEKRGFEVLQSATNFLFAKKPGVSGRSIFEKLRERKIFVRRFDGDRIQDFLRITIGTDRQMERFFAVLDDILDSGE